jgi:glycerophosphoryl diester phosphodiesterase
MSGRHPFLDHPVPLAIAHRGGSLEAEENTLPAFAHAVGLGYRHVELDVRLTRDGRVVVHHDPTLARMFGDPRAVAELDWAVLQRLRSAGGAGVPLLAEVLASWPDLFVNIEPKCDEVVEPLAALIQQTGALRRIAVGSFVGERTARLARLLGPGLCRSPDWRGVLAVRLRGLGLPLPRPGCAVLQVPVRWRGLPVVTPGFLGAAHRLHLPVQVWTVNDKAEMVRLLDMGVDAIMTDRPALLRDLLRKRGEWHGRDA